MSSWLAMLQDAAEMFVFLAVELSLLFIVISAGVSLIRQKVPDHKIQQMMGARKGRGYLLAALLGAVTPFCSCSTIPMLRGLLSAKAGFGPTLTFLFVSPLLKEGANKQVISSQADSLIKISRIWADFFPANTSNQPI